MKHAADDWAEAPTSLQDLYVPIQRELRQVESLITDELSNEHPFVDDLVKYGFRLGGKRLRPALVLLSGQAGGRLQRDHMPLAAAVELIHTATLIHDDVLGRSHAAPPPRYGQCPLGQRNQRPLGRLSLSPRPFAWPVPPARPTPAGRIARGQPHGCAKANFARLTAAAITI